MQYGDPLSRTEEQLVAMVLEGMGPARIARATRRNEQSVKNFLRTAFKKLGVSGGVQALAAEAYRQQALLLWTGQRGYYPEDDAPKRRVLAKDWPKRMQSKPTEFEERLVSSVVAEPESKTHDLAKSLAAEPEKVHFAMASLYKKAGVTTRAGLLDLVLES